MNADVSPVTAGPFIEERFYAIHHLLTALTGRDVQVYVGGDGLPVPGVHTYICAHATIE